jgi:hypothetical protein
MKGKQNSPKVKAFIRKYADYFWYIKPDAKENLSHEVLVEFILNYGNERMIHELLKLLGVKNVAKIFREQTAPGRRINYFSELVRFFNLYFDRHAPRNSYR